MRNLINIIKIINQNNKSNNNKIAETISLRCLSKATKTQGTILQKICFINFAIIDKKVENIFFKEGKKSISQSIIHKTKLKYQERGWRFFKNLRCEEEKGKKENRK